MVDDGHGNRLDEVPWVLGEVAGTSGTQVGLEAADETEIVVTPSGRASLTLPVSIPTGAPVEIQLVYPIPRGTVTVLAKNSAGEDIEGADWILVGVENSPANAAGTAIPIEVGTVTVLARAPGYRSIERAVEVKEDTVEEVVFELEPSQAVVSNERIDIKGVVNFQTSEAIILENSFSLLDDVADVLNAHPELTLVRIEGHTDTRGAADDNLDLSKRRAASVLQALVDRGVETSRLEAEGFGETRPLMTEKTKADMTKNRRVEFHVAKRIDDTPADEAP